MINITRSSDIDITLLRDNRREIDPDIERAVDEIIAEVRRNGDAALRMYTEKFDGVILKAFTVSTEEIKAGYDSTTPELLDSLNRAAKNIRDYHSRQVRNGFSCFNENGSVIGQRVIPLERVGIYVPGGTARYPSSVLMCAIPARLAGVKEIVLATPPSADGGVPAPVLAAAHIAGIDSIISVGGAQAIAAMAYGTETVRQADKIVGPGNAYVAAAKRRVFGTVDIDMYAGPSEVLIIADQNADPRLIAADMLSQAEHDVCASAVLLTDSEDMAARVNRELERQLPALPRARLAKASIEARGRIILTQDIREAVNIANCMAPEHLEINTADPFSLLGGVTSAGSVFLGQYSPEALGDYWAGPNHTLPTGGAARFSSPLSVDDFTKKSSYICYTREALMESKDHIARLARCEGLEGHARAALLRFGECL